jgi:aminopeptidase 2
VSLPKVWQEILNTVAGVSATWWDQPAAVREAIGKFRRELVLPVVDKFEFKEGEDADTIELRTIAISTAAVTGDEKYVSPPLLPLSSLSN